MLVRCRLNRLTHLDRIIGEPIRRYEHPRPGDMLHVDVEKLGRVPDGGGWRYVGRTQGTRNRFATALRTEAPKSKYRQPLIGTCYLHTVIDDHSRVAYVEPHHDETAQTAAAVLRNAVAWFAARGVTTRKVLSDNGGAYRSFCGVTPAPSSASPPSGPGPTARRPTARSSGSTAPWPTGGPSRSSTPPMPPAWPPCHPGCTSTTTIGPTQRSARLHPSPG